MYIFCFCFCLPGFSIIFFRSDLSKQLLNKIYKLAWVLYLKFNLKAMLSFVSRSFSAYPFHCTHNHGYCRAYQTISTQSFVSSGTRPRDLGVTIQWVNSVLKKYLPSTSAYVWLSICYSTKWSIPVTPLTFIF